MNYLTLQKLLDTAYAVFDTQPNKQWDDFLFDLPGDQRSAVLIQTLNYQVENGGFSQWLNNGYGDNAKDLWIVLQRIGTQSARNVENLTRIAYTANQQRQGDIESGFFDKQDAAYYKLSDQFLADAETYLSHLSTP